MKKEENMTTHFVTLIQSAERVGPSAPPSSVGGRYVPRTGLRGLIARWMRAETAHEQRLAA